MNRVTSLRLPSVRVAASGMPVASVTRWCLLPFLPRSTGLRPVLEPLLTRVWGSRRSLPARSPEHPLHEVWPGGFRAAAARHRHRSTRPGVASRSCPIRSPVPAEGSCVDPLDLIDGTELEPALPVLDVKITRARRAVFSKATTDSSGNPGGRTTVTLDIVVYEGTLTVTDPALLAQTLLADIGSGKAYGCGMLMLAQPANLRRVAATDERTQPPEARGAAYLRDRLRRPDSDPLLRPDRPAALTRERAGRGDCLRAARTRPDHPPNLPRRHGNVRVRRPRAVGCGTCAITV